MPRWPDPEDDWDDDPETHDIDTDEDDDEPTLPCPHCRSEIHEDSERCPRCGHYLSREDSPHRPKPWWLLLGVAAGLYAVLRWLF